MLTRGELFTGSALTGLVRQASIPTGRNRSHAIQDFGRDGGGVVLPLETKAGLTGCAQAILDEELKWGKV